MTSLPSVGCGDASRSPRRSIVLEVAAFSTWLSIITAAVAFILIYR